jgi:hypothetical protein
MPDWLDVDEELNLSPALAGLDYDVGPSGKRTGRGSTL